MNRRTFLPAAAAAAAPVVAALPSEPDSCYLLMPMFFGALMWVPVPCSMFANPPRPGAKLIPSSLLA